MSADSPPAASASANIARHLARMAASQPGRPAIKVPRGRTSSGDIDYLALTFAELDAETDAWVERLRSRRIAPGDRTLVMVRQGLPLIASVFALFKLGAVPVIIDPGMGLRSFLACVSRTRPRALLGIPLAQVLSRTFPRAFSSVGRRVWVSGSATCRLATAGSLPRLAGGDAPAHEPAAGDLAAILFTSGSTGAPKGVCYEHGMFDAQVRTVRDTYGIQPGEIDLPMLPVFALFNPALGMTTIVPEIDPTRPAAVEPERIVRAIEQENVTNSFGSPTLWRKISSYCVERGITLPSLRRVLMAGAPVSRSLFSRMKRIMPAGMPISPYGATEALPVASISADEALASDNTATTGSASAGGTCVGRPVDGVEVRIIAIVDGTIPTLDAARELPAGEVGEIIVRGSAVTQAYDGSPDATAAAKIAAPGDPAAPRFHRMGDAGYLDDEGRLWFCGRTAERVEAAAGVIHTEQVEPVFNPVPGVRRTALIGLGARGSQIPALVVEAEKAVMPASERRALTQTLAAAARLHPLASRIRRFYFHGGFPVDVRHNAKIHRLALAGWAASRAWLEPE